MTDLDESSSKKIWNNVALHFAMLMAFALLLNREGIRVPGWNEMIYLLYLVKAYHPNYLAGDWTMQESTAGHAVFNYAFGWPLKFMSVETFAWIGRIASWAFIFAALLRIGRQFRIPWWLVSGGIFLWLAEGQSFVANEWIVGTFEAKCAAYACLLWAIDLVLRGGTIGPAILTGLAFTFHSPIGLWGGGAVGLAFLFSRPIVETIKFAACAIVFALPGVFTTIQLMFGGHSITPDEAKFIVTTEMPFHLDPFTFGWAKIGLLYAMLAFAWLHARNESDDPKLKFLSRFELAGGLFFLFGILMRVAGQFSLVQLFPFRVIAVLVMLLFSWHLASTWWHRREKPVTTAIVILGAVIVLGLPSPVQHLEHLALDEWTKFKTPKDDFRLAAEWIRDNTPADAVVISPPWRKDSFYFTQRPQIVNWHAPRFDAMTEWQKRIADLVGDVSNISYNDNLSGALDERARQHFDTMSDAEIERISHIYHATFLITAGQYAYPSPFSSGEYKVFVLGR